MTTPPASRAGWRTFGAGMVLYALSIAAAALVVRLAYGMTAGFAQRRYR